jgi:uncharacterized membrane protein YkvA (DUF1232 family)
LLNGLDARIKYKQWQENRNGILSRRIFMPTDEMGNSEYSKEFSDESFWTKVKDFAIKAGKEVIEKALLLYYCLQDKDTPAWTKGAIIAALGYFISPIDAIPDLIPVVGFADDLGVLAAALATVAVYIKEEHKEQAQEKIKIWFEK